MDISYIRNRIQTVTRETKNKPHFKIIISLLLYSLELPDLSYVKHREQSLSPTRYALLPPVVHKLPTDTPTFSTPMLP